MSDEMLTDGIRRARAIPPGEITLENVLGVPRRDLERIFGLLIIERQGAPDPELAAFYRDVETATLAVLRRPDVGRSSLDRRHPHTCALRALSLNLAGI